MLKNLFEMDVKKTQQFVKGFNHGYVIANYLTELSKILKINVKNQQPYINGFNSGKLEFERGNRLSRLDELTRFRKIDREKDLEQER